jgi:selT/selW/selH-like putative selenoprotein
MVTVQYCAGHLHARYEWQEAQLRDALVDTFPEITVQPKPIDPHAPRNRELTGAFEVELCYRQSKGGGLVKVLLFSKLKRSAFPRVASLLEQLQKLQDEGCWMPFTPKVAYHLLDPRY